MVHVLFCDCHRSGQKYLVIKLTVLCTKNKKFVTKLTYKLHKKQLRF